MIYAGSISVPCRWCGAEGPSTYCSDAHRSAYGRARRRLLRALLMGGTETAALARESVRRSALVDLARAVAAVSWERDLAELPNVRDALALAGGIAGALDGDPEAARLVGHIFLGSPVLAASVADHLGLALGAEP